MFKINSIVCNFIGNFIVIFCKITKKSINTIKVSFSYSYPGSENEDEPQVAGEPSSIVQARGGDTLRRNFQQIQEGRAVSQNVQPPPR